MIINNKTVAACLDWAGRRLHSPEQRIILGATALATQPFIDLQNKNVDKETRKTSAARTVAKIVAGTAVGVAVRYAGIAFVRKFCQYDKVFNASGGVEKIIPKKGRSLFVPIFTKGKGGNSIFPIAEDVLTKRFDKYQKAMGTFVATVAMIATNFLLDAPLTKWFTKLGVKAMNKPDKANKQEVCRQ